MDLEVALENVVEVQADLNECIRRLVFDEKRGRLSWRELDDVRFEVDRLTRSLDEAVGTYVGLKNGGGDGG